MNADEAPEVSLQQYAGIVAALAEGHELEAVLVQEQVMNSTWRDAKLYYRDQLTSDADAFAAYERHLAVAEDHLRRDLSPLDSDLRAWTAFLEASAAGTVAPDAWGLTSSDLSRLSRQWRARFEDDPELAREASALAERGGLPLPEFSPSPAQLVPFPWTPRVEPPDEPPVPFEPDVASEPPPPVPLEPHPAMGGTARENAGAAWRPVLPYGLEPPVASPSSKPIGSAPSDAVVPPPAFRSSLEPVATMGRTVAGARPPSEPPVPFEGSAPPPRSSPLEPHPEMGRTVAAQPPRSSSLEPVAALGGTAPMGPSLPGPPLPFEGDAPAPPSLGTSLEPHPSMGQTAPLQRGSSRPTWTIELHAELAAQLAAHPDHRAELLARWGLDEARYDTVESHFRRLVARDPDARARWNECFWARYRQ